jgi:hypothetical protein
MSSTRSRRTAHEPRVATFAIVLLCAGGSAAGEETPAWELHVGHSYSSVNSLRQPATFVVSADLGRPTLTKIDAALLVDGAWGLDGGFEFGVRASGGSLRPRSGRVYGSILRGWKHWSPVVVAADGEYEADGGFDVEKGVLAAEVTPVGGLPGLGVWVRPGFRLRWRPWIGIGYGNVFSTDDADTSRESGNFWRGHARLELHYVPGRSHPGEPRAARDLPEVDVEATGWLLFDDPRGEGYVKAALAVPLGTGISLAASAEAGRQPPRFELARSVGIGVGFRY